MSRTLEIGRRFLELKESMSAKEAAEKVNELFGTDYPQRTISGYGSRYRKSLERSVQDEHSGNSEHAEQSERYERYEHADPSEDSFPSEKVEDSERKELSDHSEPSAHTLTENRVREIFREMITNMERVPIINRADLPPKPEKVQKLKGVPGENRKYQKVTVTIDKELWKRVEREKEVLGLSAGKTLDVILWRYFDKPKLSFETEDD